jgi:uroporphyrinogen decarboxylase
LASTSCPVADRSSNALFASAADLERLRDLEEADVRHRTRPRWIWSSSARGVGHPSHRLRRRTLHRGELPRRRAVPTREFAVIKTMMHREPVLFDQLLDRLVAITVAVSPRTDLHGARAVQLFDSWAGSLTRDEYRRFALPATKRVFEGIADMDVPTILFGVGTGELSDLMSESGCGVVGIDWHVDLDEGRRRVGDLPVQGNLDPARCLGGEALAVEAAREVLAKAGSEPGHIFNLGHGVLPSTDPAVLEAVVRVVHDEGKAGVR